VTAASEQTFYAAIGGADTIHRIVHRFYAGVADDPVLRPLYPEDDLTAAERRFAMFLVQYWGGPQDYSDERGHPRLRMRHAPFAVTPEAREHWLRHFRAGLDEAALAPELDAEFWAYVERASLFLVNSHDPVVDPETPSGFRL